MNEITFLANEFSYFDPTHKRNQELNEYRLRVKRKLQALGKSILPLFQEKGMNLKLRTSLHHPYIHNRFAVESLWAYFVPDIKDYAPLIDILGPDLAQDLKANYNQTLLIVGIDFSGLFISLKIHPLAWWDGQNLKNKCQRGEKKQEFHALLKSLPGFSFRLHDWPHAHKCESLLFSDFQAYFKLYVPGEHWFHLDCKIAKENPLCTSPEFANFAKEQLVLLFPVYRFIRWGLENNHVPQFAKSLSEEIHGEKLS